MEQVSLSRAPERVNTMEGINFMGTKMLIEVDSFEKRYQEGVRQVANVLTNVDINSRLSVEKNLDQVGEEIQNLRKRVENSIVLNNFNMTSTKRI